MCPTSDQEASPSSLVSGVLVLAYKLRHTLSDRECIQRILSFALVLFLVAALMSGTYVLLQYGNDAWATRFEDLEGRLAFTMYVYVPTAVNVCFSLVTIRRVVTPALQ